MLVGILTMLVSIGTYLLFANTLFSAKSDLDIQIANVLSWVCAVAFAYLTNRKYVFKSKSNDILKEASSFVLSRVTTLLIEMALMYLFYSVMHMDDAFAKIIVQVVVVILNYVFSKLLVFKKID